MRKLYLGFWDLLTKNKKPIACTNSACGEKIQVGEQYVRIRKSWRGNGSISSENGGRWKTKRFHIRCVDSFLNYQMKYRINSELETGRPRLSIPEDLRAIRASMNRKIRYIIEKMEKAKTLDQCLKLEYDYDELAAEIEEVTGIPWGGYMPMKRQHIIGDFRQRLKALQQQEVS